MLLGLVYTYEAISNNYDVLCIDDLFCLLYYDLCVVLPICMLVTDYLLSVIFVNIICIIQIIN